MGGGQRFSVVDMAVLGGVLGALLLLALLGLVFLAHKLYGPWFKRCSDKVLVRPWARWRGGQRGRGQGSRGWDPGLWSHQDLQEGEPTGLHDADAATPPCPNLGACALRL